MTNTLYTLGLQDRSLQDIVSLLAATEIKTMVDIRSHVDVDPAASLSSAALPDALTAAGVNIIGPDAIWQMLARRPLIRRTQRSRTQHCVLMPIPYLA